MKCGVDMSEATETVVMKYWKSWQDDPDWEGMRSCFSDQIVYDTDGIRLEGADESIRIMQQNPDPWKDVIMLKSIFSNDTAVLVYEGTSIKDEKRLRVCEFIDLKDGLIHFITVVMETMKPTD
jgi:hypothetical protein